jgi:hypothetical protein
MDDTFSDARLFIDWMGNRKNIYHEQDDIDARSRG